MSSTKRVGVRVLLAGLLVGVAFAGEDVTIDPPNHDFGRIQLGTTGMQTFTIMDSAGSMYDVSAVGDGAFSTDSDTITLDENGSADVVVSFAPTVEGAATATLTISTAGITVASAGLEGEGVIDDLCTALMDLSGEMGDLNAFQEATGAGEDADDDGLPEEFVIGLLQAVCDRANANGTAKQDEGTGEGDGEGNGEGGIDYTAILSDAQMAYEMNLAAIRDAAAKQAGDRVSLGEFPELFAALSLTGAEIQTAIDENTEEDLPVVTGAGTMGLIVVTDMDGNELFSGRGDLDGDGVSNAIEAERARGDLARFIELATDGTSQDKFCPGGSSFTPPHISFKSNAGDFGLLMVAAVGLLLIATMRRRRPVMA